jgi:hypothetical protein
LGHPYGTDPKFLSENQSMHGAQQHAGRVPASSAKHIPGVENSTYKGYDDRDELHDMAHHLLNQPELPPDGADNDRWADLVNHPVHGPRIERAAHHAFGGFMQDVQGYDEEWRTHLHQIDKEVHREKMSGRDPQLSWPFPTGDRVYSSARRGATSVVDKEGNKLQD